MPRPLAEFIFVAHCIVWLRISAALVAAAAAATILVRFFA